VVSGAKKLAGNGIICSHEFNRNKMPKRYESETMTMNSDLLPAWFPADLRDLLATDYPAFSPSEQTRRRTALSEAMAAVGAEHLLSYGFAGQNTATHWITGWPTTAEAVLVHTPLCHNPGGFRDKLWVQYANHVDLAGRMARDADVAWGGPVNNTDSTLRSGLAELARRGAKRGTVGVLGPLNWTQIDRFTEQFGPPINLGPAYTSLRLIKSAEEIAWLRMGAAFCDCAIERLVEILEPGLTEHQLGSIVEQSFSPMGGRAGIHYFGVTSMTAPTSFVPAQFTSSRRVARGDVLVTEISADFWGYSGQVLRSFAVGAAPSPLFRDLHTVASAAFDAILGVLRPGCTPAEIIAAAGVIEDAGFTICDDLVHGYGGGYLQPVLGSRSRPNGPLPDMVLREGMCLVVQPNVITLDRRAGVQTGELVVITANGAQSLHQSPRGFLQV
jgi:Xaa-Pro aminopeptidase